MTGPGEPLRPPGPAELARDLPALPDDLVPGRRRAAGIGAYARSVPGRGRHPSHRSGRQAAAPHPDHRLRLRVHAIPARQRGRERCRTPSTDAALTGAVACELVHLGSLYHDDVIDEAETRRGVPERERPLEQHRRHPRRRLPARPGVVARGVARRRRRRAARGDHRRAVPGPGARAAAPLRRRPLRGGLLVRDRGQDRRAVRDVVSHRRHGVGRRRRRPSTRSPASAVTSACASRSSTTCSTSPSTDAALGKHAGHDLLEGVYTLPGHLRAARVDRAARPARAVRSTPSSSTSRARSRSVPCRPVRPRSRSRSASPGITR